ncbi:PA0069 family radical SAM protein [soil metagenome]
MSKALPPEHSRDWDENPGLAPDVIAPAPAAIKGRGTASRLQGRFERWTRQADPAVFEPPSGDGDDDEDRDHRVDITPPRHPRTVIKLIDARSIVSHNSSPDIGFDSSINPYLGCEHGCIYCYARPSYAFWDLSPGLDFETRIFAKRNAVERLRATLSAPNYTVSSLHIGANTDAYQPAEREQRITRGLLELISECHHPVSLITKNALIERDIDLLSSLARRGLVRVFVSITNLDGELARTLEPRASAPWRRLETIRKLADAGIPTGVSIAPVIPALTDLHVESVLEHAHAAGARYAGYVLLRLPLEIEPLFREWLQQHHPLKAEHVMSLVTQMSGGKTYDSRFGVRGRGSGPFATLLKQRFAVAMRRFGYDTGRLPLDVTQFVPPNRESAQLGLF